MRKKMKKLIVTIGIVLCWLLNFSGREVTP